MKLPVPKLEDTLDKYKKWVKPLLNDNDYNNTVSIIDEFANGVGLKLQDLLNTQKEIYANTSWLSSSWLDSYLDGRLTPIIESNFTSEITLKDKVDINTLNRFILSLSEIARKYKTGSFDKVYDARGNEICLSQFQILKGASRIPSKNRDRYNISVVNSNYITVFYNNNLYKVDIINEDDRLLDISDAINGIISNSKEKEYSLSTISFASSDVASSLREKYYDCNSFFNVIENSLFNISICEESMSTLEDKFKFYHYLNAKNSWVYKPLNFIYNLSEEELYVNVEHTFEDGGTILEIVKRAINLMQESVDSIKSNSYTYVEEYFDESYMEEAKKIEKDYFERISKFEFKNILLDNSYFENSLKGLSKDAIMQFILQYGLIKAFGDIRGMYEAVDMREYQYGRTECVRSVSIESVSFVKSLLNGDSDALDKLKIAEVEHKNRIKSCKAGSGVNRHLLGLYLMTSKLSNEDKDRANKFFNDIGYKKISESFLSTTSLGYNPYMGYLLFTPVMDKGFGINYNYTPSGISFVISYYKSESEKANKFFEALSECVEKLKNL